MSYPKILIEEDFRNPKFGFVEENDDKFNSEDIKVQNWKQNKRKRTASKINLFLQELSWLF